MTNFLAQIEEAVVAQGLLRPKEPLLAAVSGGVDSMVLLQALRELSLKHRWRLAVAHFNHQLRGGDSDADERFVRQAAKRADLPFFSDRADVRRFAGQNKVSIEMAARRLRHEFLARIARGLGMKKIALAHHADDQVELFFLRLFRGAGVEGLAGMKWSGPSPADLEIDLIRPLLDQTRSDIQTWARLQKLRFRHDPSNKSLEFLRNRIRHELLPLLVAKYQPAITKTVHRLMLILSDENQFLAECAAEWMAKKTRPSFNRLPIALQRRCLQAQLFAGDLRAGFDIIEHLRATPCQPITLNTNTTVLRDKAGLINIRTLAERTFNVARKMVDLTKSSGIVLFDGVQIRWKLQPRSSLRCLKRPAGHEQFDAQAVGPHILLRHWQPGDRFQPIGMRTRSKLQDIFVNQKVPGTSRRELTVALTSEGEVFWVEGLRIGEACKVRKSTAAVLHWGWQRV